MNAVALFQDKDAVDELAPEFQAMVAAGDGMDALGAGIGGNYAILSIRGKTFRVKYQGAETPITDEKGDAAGSLEAVIIKANPYLTKQFYENGYTEGESSPPVCFSIDGKSPAESVENPQHTNCAACPQNRFGSRITESGAKVKACQDNKKLAIAPLADLANTAVGGPMLFRVPASALKDLLTFNNQMSARGYPYNAVAVRIGFDIDTSYPKPTFRAIRPLTSEEAAIVIEHYGSDAVERLLGDFSEIHAPVPTEMGAFEEEETAAAAPPPQPKPAPPAVKAAPAAAKVTPIKAAPTAAPKPVAAAAAPKAPPPQPKPAVTARAAPAATPAPPPARKPAVKPTPPPAPEPEVAEEAAADETEAAATPMELSIDDILSELNAVPE